MSDDKLECAWQITRESVQHLPDEEGWANLMEPLHDSLATSQLSTDRLPQLHQVYPISQVIIHDGASQDCFIMALCGSCCKRQRITMVVAVTEP